MANRNHVGIGSYIGGGVTVFPVWTESERASNLCWKPEHLTIGELPEGASVNFLEVTNNGHRPHVVVEGDIFEGGMQTRTAMTSVIVGVGETIRIPVACVEQGRWNGGRGHRVTRTRKVPYRTRGRAAKHFADVNRSRAFGAPANMSVAGEAQHLVWAEIEELQSKSIRSHSSSLAESMDAAMLQGPAFDRHDRETERIQQADLLPGQRGVIIGIGGRIVACEIFGSESGLRNRYAAILETARYEGTDAPLKRTANYRARDFAQAMEGLERLGTNLEAPLEAVTPVGPLAFTSFALANVLVHAAVFAAQPDQFIDA